MNSMSSLSSTLPAGTAAPPADGAAAGPRHRPGGIFSRFELTGKVAVISGGARGLGFVSSFLGFKCLFRGKRRGSKPFRSLIDALFVCVFFGG